MRLIKEDNFYLIVILFLIMIMAIRTPLDSDMWWHLRAGEQTWLDKQVYTTDTFSHTRAGSDWINHSWLSQVMMYGIFNLGGLTGLAIWVGICAVISVGILYKQMDGHPLLRGAVLLFAAVIASVVWAPRPQIHSLVCFSITSLILNDYRKQKNWKILLLLLPLFILWGNLHGGYVLGFILIGAVLTGEILNRVLFLGESLGWPDLGRLLGISIAGFVFVVINPLGIEIWKIPFNTVAVETLQNLINEWASPDFHYIFQQPMMWMMLGAFSLMALSGRKPDGVEIVTLAVFSWLALTARRNFGPFALATAPIFGNHLNALLIKWKTTAGDRSDWTRRLSNGMDQDRDLSPWLNNLVNLLVIGLLLIAVGWKTNYAVLEKFHEAEEKAFPVQAVDWLTENEVKGNLFNDYNWGGYLIWHLRDYPVFVDGRTDLFGDQVLNDYLEVMGLGDRWEGTLAEYDIRAILVESDSYLAKFLSLSNWKEVYRDDLAVIYIKE